MTTVDFLSRLVLQFNFKFILELELNSNRTEDELPAS